MLCFIVNEHSRSGKGAKIWKEAEAVLKKKNIAYESYVTQYEGHAFSLAHDICECGADDIQLVVVGGDGTANEVINGMTHFEKVRFGVIPTGSGNDLARGLGITGTPTEVIGHILNCREDYVMDLGQVSWNGCEKPRLFAISAGAGLDALVCKKALKSKVKDALNKLHLGKLTYLFLTVQSLFTMQTTDAAAVFDGKGQQNRKKMILKEGSAQERVAALVAALVKDGYDFSVGIPADTPIPLAERVVSAGKGIGSRENMKLIEELAKQAGAAIGSSRPVAETLKYVPLNRYVGMSGQKFTGNLYIACGISGAVQHLKGIRDASTIVAINKNANAPIFKNCDYGIIGDVNEILPLLSEALNNGEAKKPAPPMVKMKRPLPPKPAAIGKTYVCGGCGYEYDPAAGDPDSDIAPGTLFEKLPADWVCPECAESKDMFM
jgi:electron transfer flavoprotein alpha subunit/rubredoxin